ncbi:MAG: hypothetical protein ACFCVF_15725, partial [Kineosporiaceae bacterium]
MPTYAVDGARTVLVGTGNVEAVTEWMELPDGSRKRTDTQARHPETGMPLWGVEVLVSQVAYGRESMVTSRVNVGAPAEPRVARFAPVGFVGLVVDVRVNKRSGALSESWRAEEMTAPSTPAAASAGASSGGKGSGA